MLSQVHLTEPFTCVNEADLVCPASWTTAHTIQPGLIETVDDNVRACKVDAPETFRRIMINNISFVQYCHLGLRSSVYPLPAQATFHAQLRS